MLEAGVPVAESDIDTWCQTWDVNLKVSDNWNHIDFREHI